MEANLVSRRRAIGLLTAASGLVMTRIEPYALTSIRPRVQHVFFAAGVRFHPSMAVVTNGAIVSLHCESCSGALAYAIFVANGVKIGYVPRALAQGMGDPESWEGRLQAVDRDGVPWKRYKVSLISRI